MSPQVREKAEMIAALAGKQLSKTGLLQFRIEPPVLEQLYAYAASKQQPLGTIVRDWVVERFALEQAQTAAENAEEAALRVNVLLDALRTNVGVVISNGGNSGSPVKQQKKATKRR